MKKCILRERLFVPATEVTEEHLLPFIHVFEDIDPNSAGEVRHVKTFNKVTIKGVDYFGFSRGDIVKLGKMFGHLDWVDQTAAPLLTSNLQFKEGFALMNFAEHGRGQLEAVTDWMKRKGGIIRAAPRFGKTVSAIYLITQLRKKTLIVTHQQDLLQQFYNSFVTFSNVQQLWDQQSSLPKAPKHKRDATEKIVGFFSDYDNPEELDVCLLCWQTFASKHSVERLEKYRDHWGLLVVDEAHRMGGLKFASTMNKLNPRHRLGLTGTVERTDAHEKVVMDILGPVVAEGRVKQVPCEVVAIKTKIAVSFSMQEPFVKLFKRLYVKPRIEIILKWLRQDVEDGRYICVAFHRYSVKQLNHFVQLLQAEGMKAEAFYGGMKKNREKVLNEFRDGTLQVAVCNSSMLTGIDVPRWNTYYCMFPSGNVVFNEAGQLSGNYYQEFSRVRTPFIDENGEMKKYGLIRDFVDDNGFCQGTFRKRMKAYVNQGFTVQMVGSVDPINESYERINDE